MPASTGVNKEFLSDFSEKDAKFDLHKGLSTQIARLYALESSDGVQGFMSGERFIAFKSYAGRIGECGSWLKFWQTDSAIKLIDARFCKVSYCPMCQFRRSLKWRAKFLAELPAIQETYPTHKWVFLTLTVRNCEMSELRSQIQAMGKAFSRMTKLASYPLVGAIKSLEVTRVWDWYDKAGNFIGRHGTTWFYRSNDPDKPNWTVKPTNEVHPHFHVLGLVPASYFTGRGYIKQEQWAEMWKQSLRVDYDPIIHIQAVKSKKGKAPISSPEEVETDDSGMIKGICETLKYTIKENDLVGRFCDDEDANSNWLKAITQELHKLRKVDYGGVLKAFGKEVEASMDDLIGIDDEKETVIEKEGKERIAHYNFHLKKYIMMSA